MIGGRDAPWVEATVAAWDEGLTAAVADLVACGPWLLDLVVLPPPGGLDEHEVAALSSMLVVRALTEGFPPPETVAEDAALRAATKGAKGKRRFDPPEGYSARDQRLLVVLLFAVLPHRGRRTEEDDQR